MAKDTEVASTSTSAFSTERHALSLRGLGLFVLSFQTLGIIYSDIGTSPLYVLNGIWSATGEVPPKEDVIGGVSAIIWALTILPLAKYVLIALRFGTSEGEGGTFALFHGLFPPAHRDLEVERTLTGEFEKYKPPSLKSSLLRALKVPLLAWALFGTSLTMADGVLTPAVSVTSAVSGIAVVKPNVSSNVAPISIGFIIVLFLLQRFGTSRLSFTFAPVTFIWLSLIGICGIINIVKYPGIFRAFDPSRAVMLFVRTGNYDILSGVLLAITGSEALFANLGQFNRASIQIAFAGFVYPCLVLAYLGQGARLIVDGENVLPNLFYLTIPGKQNGPLFWIVYIAALLATLIASQAMITATFSLAQQVINLKSMPPLRMIYTSEKIQGQIYIPFVNWVLMIGTVIMVGAFKNLAHLTNAYGFAVATVMFVTTVLLTFQMRYVKRFPWIIALAYFLFFGFMEGLFWGASLKKVPAGAWVPLMIGTALGAFMCFWTWAKGLEDAFDSKNRQNLKSFISTSPSPDSDNFTVGTGPDDVETEDIAGEAAQSAALYYVASRTGDSARSSLDVGSNEKAGASVREERRELLRIPTCAVFHKLTPGKGVPHSFVGFVRQYPALPKVVIFVSVQVLPIARVQPEARYKVTKVRSISGFYGVTYLLGFRDDFNVKVDDVIEHILRVEMHHDPESFDRVSQEIQANANVSTHIVPHYHVVSRDVDNFGKLSPAVSWVRRLLIEGIYHRFVTMFPETANWTSSANEIIHVGIHATI